MMILRNCIKNCTRRCSTLSKKQPRKKLVVLGTGWGSYSLLKSINKALYDVVVVSPRNHFLFTPLLASTTVGTLEFRSIIEPIRNYGFQDEHNFHLSTAKNLNIEKQNITCCSALDSSNIYEIPYDILIIGVGANPNTFNIPGVEEYAHFLKEISDARNIRNAILKNFELATQPSISIKERDRLLHFVIVGGGPTGIEFGAEFYDFLTQDLNKLYPDEVDRVHITLIEANEILSAFDEKLRNYTERVMKKRERMKIQKAAVTKVTKSVIELNDGSSIPYGMVVWSTGIAPREFVKNTRLDTNEYGQILVDDFLRVPSIMAKNVYAIGDCAQVISKPTPCTAQVAERQGRYLAKLLNAQYAQKECDPFVFKPWGMLAYVGDYKALVDTPVAKSQGMFSWILWRSAYTTRLGSWRLRMQVPVDWMKAFFFGRDTSRF